MEQVGTGTQLYNMAEKSQTQGCQIICRVNAKLEARECQMFYRLAKMGLERVLTS